jgi:hypothetical protein
MVCYILGFLEALGAHDAHPMRWTEEVTESHTERRIGRRGELVLLRVPEPRCQASHC